jgi:uncharacterized protein
MRQRLRRRIMAEPSVTYFKPAGVPLCSLKETVISFEEFEAVRLKDFLGFEQEVCAQKMGISQPTFHRILVCVRKKIAGAIVEGSAIKIEGGNYILEKQKEY